MKNWVKKFIDQFLIFLLPERCLRCGKSVEILCDLCVYTLPQGRDSNDAKIFSAFSYQDNTVKKILINLKYFNKKSFGGKLGQILYERMLEEISDIKNFDSRKVLIIPVPITKKRLRERGYNQALLIARGIAGCDDAIFELRDDILIKNRETIRQAKIQNREKRLRNLHCSFSCIKNKHIKGRTIIIIDDITTTGATLNEAIKELEKSGAGKVFGFTVAH